MSAPTLPVPDLAPSLGRLIVPRRLQPLWVTIDDVRELLATRVMEHGGEARTTAARGATVQALSKVGRDHWMTAWEEAVRQAAERVAAAVDQAIEREAQQVRMPRRHWARLRVAGAERRAMAARLASGGESFAAALDNLESRAGELARADADPAALEAWQLALCAAARRLEAAWLALETQVEAERERWTPELEAIRRWRPALWPVFVVWVPIGLLLIWLGLVAGGYLPAPSWLAEYLGF